MDDGSGHAADEVLEAYHREHLARTPSPAVVTDLLRWFSTGTAAARSGWLDYQAGLTKVPGPGLILAGSSDPVAPPEDALEGVASMPSSAEISFHHLSRVEGMREEYGHLGMLLSQHAARDTDQLILRWLRRTARPR